MYRNIPCTASQTLTREISVVASLVTVTSKTPSYISRHPLLGTSLLVKPDQRVYVQEHLSLTHALLLESRGCVLLTSTTTDPPPPFPGPCHSCRGVLQTRQVLPRVVSVSIEMTNINNHSTKQDERPQDLAGGTPHQVSGVLGLSPTFACDSGLVRLSLWAPVKCNLDLPVSLQL